MKKIKVMLLSLAMFAVVGGALAFKAKYSQSYCTAQPNSQGKCPSTLACPNLRLGIKITQDAGDFVCTTTINENCTLPCTTEPSTKITAD